MPWLFEYSNREDWSTCDDEYDTKEEAIAAGIEYFQSEDPDVFQFDVGEKVVPAIPTVSVDSILEDLSCQMYEEAGDIADDWLMHTKPEDDKLLEYQLNQVIRTWMEATNNLPHFFVVKRVETVLMPMEF